MTEIGEEKKSLEVPVGPLFENKEISREDKGVKFEHSELRWPPIKAVTSINDKRISLSGDFSITKTKGSYKFGEEIQIQVFTSAAPLIESRAKNNGWNRVEIFLPYDKETLNYLKKAIEKIEKGPGAGPPPA